MKTTQQTEIYPFLQGGGEMGGIIRDYNWSETSLGTIGQWPLALQISLTNILNSGLPMFLFWGSDLICFYNDAYRPSLGANGKHPAIGKPGKEVWAEIWDFAGPLIQSVLETGKPVWFENQLVPFYRNGRIEDIYWTFSHSLVVGDDGKPGGVQVSCVETTQSVLAHQKLDAANKKFESLVLAAPMAINIQKGPDMIVELANEPSLEIWNKKAEEVLGKSLLEVLPELKSQGAQNLYHRIVETAKPYYAPEIPFNLFRKGREEVVYFNLMLQPYYEGDSTKATGMVTFATEVTGQVKARQHLIESEARFRNIIEQAPVAIGLTSGADFIFESINPPMLQIIHKKNKDEVLGKTVKEVLPELISQPVYDTLLGVLQTGETFQGTEVEIEMANERVLQRRYFNLNYSRIINANGTPSVLHMATDVTDQVLARRKIEESEVRFRTMAENTPVLIAVADETSNATYFNKAWTDLTGRPLEKLFQFGWLDLVHPDDKEKFVKIYLDAFANNASFTGEFRVLNPHGKYSFLLAHSTARFDAEGQFLGYISACTDISEQKNNQQALQTALEQVRLSKEAAELGTFDMDLETGNMHWDDRCRILFGISHHQPVSFDYDFIKGLHPEDQERVVEVVRKSFDKSLSNGDYDVEYRTIGAEDRELRWVRAKGKVYFNAQEKPVRFIGSVLDITAQKTAMQKIEQIVEERTRELAQANESLHVINKELQRSNQNLEEFAYAASHDLKEPVRKILVLTSRLRDQLSGHLNEAEARSFHRIENATKRMGNLIDDLLRYSHVSHRPHETETVDLNQKVQRVLEDLELDIEEKKAVIHVGKLPVVHGYRRQLQQLFQNLISNSLKYSKAEEPPIIEITAEQVERNDVVYHNIKVRDNGIGFEQKFEDKIFQMFSRLHGKAEYSGTGVGLSIVKKVVENHDGFIQVESKPGTGSTFEIYLKAK